MAVLRSKRSLTNSSLLILLLFAAVRGNAAGEVRAAGARQVSGCGGHEL